MRYAYVVLLGCLAAYCAHASPKCDRFPFGAVEKAGASPSPAGEPGRIGVAAQLPKISTGVMSEYSGFSCGHAVAVDLDRHIAYQSTSCFVNGSDPLPKLPEPTDASASVFRDGNGEEERINVVYRRKLSGDELERVVCASNMVWSHEGKQRDNVLPPHSLTRVVLQDKTSFKEEGVETELNTEAEELVTTLWSLFPKH